MEARKKRKEPLWGWVVVIAALALGGYYTLWPTPNNPLSEPPTSEQVTQGQKIFQQNCAACHGPAATGQNPKRPKGGMMANGTHLAPALNGTGHAWHHANELLFNTVKHGSMAKDSPMRGFADRLSDEEIVSVLQYVKSLWPDEIRVRHAMMGKGG